MSSPSRPNDIRGIEAPVNRAFERSRDGDTFKTPAITLYDHDYAIMWWLQNRLSLQVIDNGTVIPVPVIYGSGEKWAQVQQYGFLRDKSGKLQVPLIVIQRTNVEKDTRISQLDVEYDQPQRIKVVRTDGVRNSTATRDTFSKLYNAQKPHEFFIMAVPSFIMLSYEVVLWTDYMEQMNHLIHEIEPTDGWAWGDTWKFPTRINGYNIETITGEGEERVVRCTLQLNTWGMILNEFESKISTIEKSFSLKRVTFNNERSQFAGYVDNLPKDLFPDDDTLEMELKRIYNGKYK